MAFLYTKMTTTRKKRQPRRGPEVSDTSGQLSERQLAVINDYKARSLQIVTQNIEPIEKNLATLISVGQGIFTQLYIDPKALMAAHSPIDSAYRALVADYERCVNNGDVPADVARVRDTFSGMNYQNDFGHLVRGIEALTDLSLEKATSTLLRQRGLYASTPFMVFPSVIAIADPVRTTRILGNWIFMSLLHFSTMPYTHATDAKALRVGSAVFNAEAGLRRN